MKKLITAAIALSGAGLLLAACVAGGGSSMSSTGENGISDNPDAWSGYKTATAETQAMNDDDFENPVMPYVDLAAGIYNSRDNAGKISCADCHGAPDDATGGRSGIPMKGVGANYPRFNAETGKPINVELQINKCREERQVEKGFKYEGDEMIGMTALVRMQSRGMPVVSKAADPANELHAAWTAGKEFYYQRRGQLDMACSNCHEDHAGDLIRAETLSQGQSNGFPTYRFKWQKPGTLHRRFAGCNKNIRAEAFGRGSDEYLNLETYLAWRGRGLPVEAPSVRK
ncbi:MAG: sulfur oxidation c-type cytochrome SoxA [Rhodospirillaceae bacterium]|nr:sulfur oxidation c-type cytochrome SoxA [Rhodospirillaceae bacterium]